MKSNGTKIIFPFITVGMTAILAGLLLLLRDYWLLLQDGHCPLLQQPQRVIIVPFVLIVVGLVLTTALLLRYTHDVHTSRDSLKFLLTHDPLTGLPNRISAEQALQKLIAAKRDFTIITIDIDDFKSLNYYYSRNYGDKLLVKLAERLQTLESDGIYSVYRFTSDEFTLLLRDRQLRPNCAELYFLRQLLSEPFSTDDTPIFIKTSMGVAVSDARIQDCETFLSDTNIAMYEAKKHGRNKTAFFTEDMRRVVQEKQRTVKDIEYACQHGGFYVVFQPQIDVRTGDICGYEALARLKITQDGTERTIPPISFIPAAEKSGYITKIGRIITEKTIRHMVEWRRNGFQLHKVSINYSVGQIADKGYVNYLSDLLEENAISPDLVCMEITESLFLENRKRAMELFDQFRAIGVQLALDDFGTGYSSLSYLAYLPVTTVKIDKSMIDTYLSQEDKCQFIQNIVNLVHSLHMQLTVEGIEELWQYRKICEFGADHIQGYFFSKPMPADEVEAFTPTLPK